MINWRMFLIEWNNKFPLDKEYRRKHNISFNSPQHRELNPVDIYLEWLENEIFDEFIERAQDMKAKEKEYNQGILLRESSYSKEQEMDLFDKIDISKINSSSNIQVEK